MKKLLPILLCYVLMTSQVFAISGGPTSGGNSLSPIGTYSGVMIAKIAGVTNTTDLFTVPPVALGLFSLSVPTTNVATGAFLLFQDSNIFTGNFDASVDPDNDQLAGIALGYDYVQVVGSDTSGAAISVTEEGGFAVGSVIAKIGGSGKNANSSARINGSAQLVSTIFTSNGGTGNPSPSQTYSVIGYRQSITSSTVSSLPTVITTTGN